MNDFPKYEMIFSDFGNTVQEKYPSKYDMFQRYSGDLILKLRCLEIICLRYKEDQQNHAEILLRINRMMNDPDSYTKKEYQNENKSLAESTIINMTKLIVDVESFYIYTRIILDKVPNLVKPFLMVVSKQQIKTSDFLKFVDWFYKNQTEIFDDSFKKEILSFRDWFLDDLRTQRNEWIVHTKKDIIHQAILPDGTIEMKRIRKNNDIE